MAPVSQILTPVLGSSIAVHLLDTFHVLLITSLSHTRNSGVGVDVDERRLLNVLKANRHNFVEHGKFFKDGDNLKTTADEHEERIEILVVLGRCIPSKDSAQELQCGISLETRLIRGAGTYGPAKHG